MLTITTRSRSDAECIARELAAFAAEMEEALDGWSVTIDDDSEIVPVLGVLETCFGTNGIDSVSVSYGGRKYVMEGRSR